MNRATYYADRAREIEPTLYRVSHDHEVSVKYGKKMVASDDAFGRASNVTAGWGQYNGRDDRRYDVVGPDGKVRMLTYYGFRVWVDVKPLLRASNLPGTGNNITSVAALALSSGASKPTVSRWLRKLMAWGWIATTSHRGRKAFVMIYAAMDTFTERAKKKILQAWRRARARAWARMMANRDLNVSPVLIQGDEDYKRTVDKYLSMYGETFNPERENERLAEALHLDPSRQSGRAACPAHGEHRNKTLSWKRTGDRLLVHCFAGCTFAEIRKAAVG